MKSLLILMLVLLAGCGDLFGTKVVKKKLESDRFRVNCQLDVNAFTDILRRNISSDIKCLEENLNLFIKIVKTDRPGYLSRIRLEQFVIKNRPDIKPEMVRAMKAIFDVNYLVTGENPEYISQNNINKLVSFALLFNEKSSQHFFTTFGNEAETPWDVFNFQRGIVRDSAKVIVGALIPIFKEERDGEIRKLNILDLLDNFTTEDNREQLEKVKKMLFVKKIILGGTREEITHLELYNLLGDLQPLLSIAHDGIRFQYVTIGQEKIIEMLYQDLDKLNNIIHKGKLGNRDNMVLFTIDEVLDVARQFVEKQDFDINKFQGLIREAKKLVVGGNLTDFKGIELKSLFNQGMKILSHGQSFHGFYKDFRIVMESPLPVTLDFNQYRHSYPDTQKELSTFERIVKKYRFFKGEFESAYFTPGFKRNADGIFEVYLLEYVIKIIFKEFGAPSPNANNPFGFSMDQFQMQAVFKKFQKDLVALELLSPLWVTITSDNVSLLGTLFQYQSDKNSVMDVNEATEFGVSLITSLGVSSEIMDYMKDRRCGVDQYGRIEPNCMRRNFFPAMCSQYRTYFPSLFSSINTPKLCENIPMDEFNTAFLERSILAARPCNFFTDGNKEEIWFTKDDINTMLMVILHAETTVLRWDTNGNNILDPDEVNEAYDIYSPALDGFLETRPPIVKKFKRQIYQYLIKFEEVPDEKNFSSMWKFIKFMMSFRKASSATRKTITSVLMAIGEENKKLPNAPKIDCNYLRDPSNLPTVIPELSGPALVDDREDHSGILNGFLEFAD